MLALQPPAPAVEPPMPRRLLTHVPGHAGIIVRHYLGCVRQVRRWVEQSPHVTAMQNQQVVLVASELVTNALRHSRSGRPGGETVAELVLRSKEIVLWVSDQGPLDPCEPTRPSQRDSHERFFAESGHGLALVANLATYWDWMIRPDGGVSVSAAFTR